LQSTAPLTDFGYAGMFYNADSGLYLTPYRAYDPVAGRRLSRDPVGETRDQAGSIISTSLDDMLGASAAPTDISGNAPPAYASAADQAAKISANDIGSSSLARWPNFGNYSFLSRFLENNPTSLRSLNSNLYTYVEDNPISRIDPDGEDYRSWRSWAAACYMIICWKNFPDPTPAPPPPICITVRGK
jgi:RHS repeat-associated protein